MVSLLDFFGQKTLAKRLISSIFTIYESSLRTAIPILAARSTSMTQTDSATVLEPHSSTPRGQLNPTPRARYNLVVIGGGPAGMACASGAATLGAHVALVEKNTLGGNSLTAGSVPSKALIRSARVAAEMRRAADFGIQLSGPFAVDFSAVMDRMREVQERIAALNSIESLLDKGVDVFLGEGTFTDASHVLVSDKTLTFSRAVIAAGASPAPSGVPGIEQVPSLTYDTLFRLTELPNRLAIIGAGPLGCELAQSFARLGSSVIVYERQPQILAGEDMDAAALVQQSLERDGVTFRLGCKELRAETIASAHSIHSQAGEHWFADPCDLVLIAAGRAANTSGLHLDAAGVTTDDDGIVVNNYLRTTNSHIFAAGDCCSQYKFTHAAIALARIVIANALFFGTDKASSLLIPWCTYTDPQCAHVGVQEQDAAKLHLNTMSVPFSECDRSIIDGDTDGLFKVHYDIRGAIRGATVVSGRACELIGELVLAMNHNVRLAALATDIHPYPTESEILKQAGDIYRRSFVTPSMAKFLRKLLEFRR
jgi:pyruvate/2-oxoglutarate dehydrogenase complex dihydrolipoamide dehydrogenase (E3) component